MNGYILILISLLLIAVTFSLSKLHQLKVGDGIFYLAISSICSAPVTILMFFCLNNFHFEFALFSLICAFSSSLCCFLYSILGMKLMSYGKYSVYMTFLMSGGMTLPFIFGIVCLGEAIRPLRIIGIIMIIVCVILLNRGSDKSFSDAPKCSIRKYTLFCFLVFFLNGCLSIITKVHQITTVFPTVSSTGYVVLSSASNLVFNLIMLCISAQRNTKSGDKPQLRKVLFVIFISLLSTLIGAVTSTCQLEGAKMVDASVLYPMITGGTIVLSAVSGRVIFKEKMNKRNILITALCFVATVLFVEF